MKCQRDILDITASRESSLSIPFPPTSILPSRAEKPLTVCPECFGDISHCAYHIVFYCLPI